MTDVHMKEAIERLRKEARDALKVYSDQCLKYGGEPTFPQWAKDALDLCKTLEGFRLAPVEPTKEMLAAPGDWNVLPGGLRVIYQRMLAAAPQPPQENK